MATGLSSSGIVASAVRSLLATASIEEVLDQENFLAGVEYLSSVLDEVSIDVLRMSVDLDCSQGDSPIDMSIDLDGLKDVLESFVPELKLLSKCNFVDWFDGLVAEYIEYTQKANAQITLDHDETAPSLTATEDKVILKTGENLGSDEKRQIIEKFSFVPVDEYEKEHRPHVAAYAESSKLRYINNQVVSTKGERYIRIVKPETEETKKTYVSIKQLRRFRFH